MVHMPVSARVDDYISTAATTPRERKIGCGRGIGVPEFAEVKRMDADISAKLKDAIAFLRMSAIELRRIAERAPDITDQLRHIARQLEAEANDLAGLNP
jgi:hypothetical protein